MNWRRMLGPTIAASLMLVGNLALSGCGEVAYKRGASDESFEAAKQSCHAQAVSDAAYHDCMHAEGWLVASLEATDAPATDTPAADTAAPEAAAPVSTTPAVVAAAAAPIPGSPATAMPATAAPVAPATAAPVVATATAPAAKPAPADPTKLVPVGAWWKASSGAADLTASINDCLATLGESYRPATPYHLFARGLVSCLHARGWHTFGEIS